MSMPDRSSYSVFISYSRKDLDFVRQLFDKLGEKGRSAWVDWRGIDYSTKWWEEICDGIERADNFVLVVSPDSMNSEHCHREIAHARQYSKRIITFHYNYLESEEANIIGGWYKKPFENLARDNWEQLKTIQFISLPKISDFDQAVDALIRAVDNDPEHLRTHTRFVQWASEWERRERNPNFLLRGDDLAAAEKWLEASPNKNPTPSELHRIYISASRQHEDLLQREVEAQRRRTRRLTLAAIVAGVVGALAMVATVYAGLQTADAFQQVDAAQQTLTPIPPTLTAAGMEVRTQAERAEQAGTQAADAQAQMAAVTPSLAAILTQIQVGHDQIESLRLASLAKQINPGDQILAIRLALEANAIDDPPLSVQQTLGEIVYASGPRQSFSGHEGFVYSSVYSPDGRTVLSGSDDGMVKVWDVASGKVLHTFSGHESAVFSVAYSPDGRTALSGSWKPVLKLWDVVSGEVLHTFSGHKDAVFSVAYSPDGRMVLSGSRDGTLKLWDVASGEVLHTFSGHKDFVYSAIYSPDGRTVLSGSRDGTLKLWDVASGEVLHTFSGHKDAVFSVAYSPDGQMVLSGSRDGTLKLWDVVSRTELRTFSGHEGFVSSVAYSPDGRTAVSGSGDGTLKLWDVASGEVLHTLSNHKDAVDSVAYGPDGQTVLSGSYDGTLELWDVVSITSRSDVATGQSGSSAEMQSLQRIDTLSQLIDWTYQNREVRELTCVERQTYNVAPLCVDGTPQPGGLPSVTPYPTLTPIIQTWTPIPTATIPVWTPIPSPTTTP